jgi:hypothetical protein
MIEPYTDDLCQSSDGNSDKTPSTNCTLMYLLYLGPHPAVASSNVGLDIDKLHHVKFQRQAPQPDFTDGQKRAAAGILVFEADHPASSWPATGENGSHDGLAENPGQRPRPNCNPLRNDLIMRSRLIVPNRLDCDRASRREIVDLREAASRAGIDRQIGDGDVSGLGGTAVAQQDRVTRCHAGPHVAHDIVDRQRRALLIESRHCQIGTG